MIKCKSDFNLLLFFGSGISLPSGLPTTTEITNKLLNDEWHDHTDQNFYSGKHPNPFFQESNIVPRLQSFLKILYNSSSQYLRKRERSESNYEDLFYICVQIADDQKWIVDNPTIEPFIDNLNEDVQELLKPLPNKEYFEIDLGYLASRSCDFIQCVVWNVLGKDQEPIGLDLIINLINYEKLKKLDIVTLNHDLLIEKLLDNNKIKYIDGFGELDGEVRWFLPHLYDNSDINISLYKPHGSINWCYFRTTDETTKVTVDRLGLSINPDFDHCKDSDGYYLTNISYTPSFLTGTYNKLLSYNSGIYKQIHNRFDVSLENHNTIIMSGYGWNDRGINSKLFEWLGSSKNNRIILLHKNPISIKEKSKGGLWNRYERLVSNKMIIPIEKWLSDTALEDIIDVLF